MQGPQNLSWANNTHIQYPNLVTRKRKIPEKLEQ